MCRYVDLPLQHASPAVLKRMRRPGNRRTYDTPPGADPRPGAGRHAAHHVHRRLPGRNRSGLRGARATSSTTPSSTIWASSPIPTRKAPGRSGCRTTSRRRLKRKRRQRADVAAESASWRAAQRARLGKEVKVLVDGPSPEHELVLQGRLEGQAPDIDRGRVPDGLRSGGLPPGELIRARDGRRPGLRSGSPRRRVITTPI